MPPSTQHAEPNAGEGLLAQCEETEPGEQGREAPKRVPGDVERRGGKNKMHWGGGAFLPFDQGARQESCSKRAGEVLQNSLKGRSTKDRCLRKVRFRK